MDGTYGMAGQGAIYFLRFNGLLGPFIFTIVNLKKRPAITRSASYSMGLCPLA